MTVVRMAARRHRIIEKTVPQAAEEWLARHTSLGKVERPVLHHLIDQLMHLGYGAMLGTGFSAAVRARPAAAPVRGAAFGLATWIVGSWLVAPLVGAKAAPSRARLPETAVDLAAHLLFGIATSIVVEELSTQTDRGPSPDSLRRMTRIG